MVDEAAVMERSIGHSELWDLVWYSSNKNNNYWTNCFVAFWLLLTCLKDKPNAPM
jgi:hypothetical protein